MLESVRNKNEGSKTLMQTSNPNSQSESISKAVKNLIIGKEFIKNMKNKVNNRKTQNSVKPMKDQKKFAMLKSTTGVRIKDLDYMQKFISKIRRRKRTIEGRYILFEPQTS